MLKYIMLLGGLVIIFFNGCSTMKCNKFGIIEYCSPKLKDNIETIKKDFKSTKTKSEKKFYHSQKSKQLSNKWSKTITDVKKFLIKYNIKLYSMPIKASGEGLFGNNKAVIKIIHKDDNVTFEFDKEFEKNLEKEYKLAKIIHGKEQLKKNPELLYNISPNHRAVFQLIKSKKLIANEFNILVGSKQLSKLLSKYYIENQHDVYIVSQNISPHVDIKANLYLPSNLTNSDTLDLIMLHEAFHLIPVGINNQYIQNRFLKAFSSKRFLLGHKNVISGTPQTNDANNIDEKDGLAINPTIFSNKFTKIFSKNLNESNELIIDGRVLSYIKNDYVKCIKYYNILKRYNIDKSDSDYQRERLPLIYQTCNYIKKGYSFTYFTKNSIATPKEISRLTIELILAVKDDGTIDKYKLKQILKEFISKKYKNKDEQDIVLLWLYSYMSITLDNLLYDFNKRI